MTPRKVATRGSQARKVPAMALALPPPLEEAMRHEEEQWQSLFSVLPVGIAILDAGGNIREFNSALAGILGISDAGLRAGRYRQRKYLHWDGTEMAPGDLPSVRAVAEQRIIAGVEIGVLKEDGTITWTEVSAAPLAGPNTSCVVATIDISGRKQAETTLSETIDHLERLAGTDPLTGALNRRQFGESIVREIHRANRYKEPISLLMLDVDHFKKVNDTYGHQVGDQVLRQVADSIRSVIRLSDFLARWGGEEFLILLPNTGEAQALLLADRIRQRVAGPPSPQGQPAVTVSMGVAEYVATNASSEWIDRADKAMYRAKQDGRNCVRVDTPTGGVPSHHNPPEATFLKLVWNPNYMSGHALIDGQHEALFSRSNELLDAFLAHGPGAEVSLQVARLLEEVKQHFLDEERILKEVGFPGLTEHAGKHLALLDKATMLDSAFKAGTLTQGNLFQFLAQEVVAAHMLRADVEFFPFLKT